MKSLVIQSCSAAQYQGWQGRCIASVRRWAAAQGHDHQLLGDEIFALVPDWYLAKVRERRPIATDFARLVLAQQALAAGRPEVIWLDADTLVLGDDLRLEFTGTCAFGEEVWVQPREGRWQVRRNLHNAVAVFRPGCPVLPFLLHCVASLMQRVDPDHIAPQFVGPKLLQALQTFADFARLPQVGSLSPAVALDLQRGGGPALDLLCQTSQPLPQALNLCASLLPADQATAVIESLQSAGLSSKPDR